MCVKGAVRCLRSCVNFAYIKPYVMYYYVTNTEMVASNIHVLLGSEPESESDNSIEVK